MAWFGNWKVEVDNDESFIVFQKKETKYIHKTRQDKTRFIRQAFISVNIILYLYQDEALPCRDEFSYLPKCLNVTACMMHCSGFAFNPCYLVGHSVTEHSYRYFRINISKKKKPALLYLLLLLLFFIIIFIPTNPFYSVFFGQS